MNKNIIITFVLLIVLFIIIVNAFQRPPFFKASPEEFWSIATDIEFDDSLRYLDGAVFLPDSDRYYYLISYNNSYYYEVSKDDMNKYYPEVIEKLNNFSPDDNTSSDFAKVHSAFLENVSHYSDNPKELVKLIISSGLSVDENVNDYVINYQKIMSKFCFFVIFDAVILLGLCFWLVSSIKCRKILCVFLRRLGYTPFFMLLPYYLGFAPYSFRLDVLEGSNYYGIYSKLIYLYHSIFPGIFFDDWLLGHVSQLMYRFLGLATEISLESRGDYSGLISALLFGFAMHALVGLAVIIRKKLRRSKA